MALNQNFTRTETCSRGRLSKDKTGTCIKKVDPTKKNQSVNAL